MSARLPRALALSAVVITAALGLASAQDTSHHGAVLPKDVVAAASAYQTYMQHAAELKTDYRDGEGVHQRLRTGVAYEQAQFEEGMIGYGALVALQDAHFLNGLERVAHTPEARHALAERLLAKPSEVLDIDGAGDTARLVASVLTRQANAVIAAGKAVKQSAYDIQHQDWSKAHVGNTQVRMREVKSLSSARFVATDADNARLMKAMLDLPEPDHISAPVSPVIQRALALAALAKLGEADNADQARLAPLLGEYYANDCLHMAKLNLYQCMAVAVPHYEDVFCLGEHALKDTGECVAAAVNASPTRFAPPFVAVSTAPVPAPPAKPVAHRHHRHG